MQTLSTRRGFAFVNSGKCSLVLSWSWLQISFLVIAAGLSEVMLQRYRQGPSNTPGANKYNVTLNSVLLSKCIAAKLWENSRYVARQLDRIGPALASSLVTGRITSFTALENAHPRDIEMVGDMNALVFTWLLLPWITNFDYPLMQIICYPE